MALAGLILSIDHKETGENKKRAVTDKFYSPFDSPSVSLLFCIAFYVMVYSKMFKNAQKKKRTNMSSTTVLFVRKRESASQAKHYRPFLMEYSV